jgi:lipoteichoic acid synthase
VFSAFFSGIQQDFKVFLFAPIVCAVFRAIFIGIFNPYKTFKGKWRQIYHCFRYGFWWGMDYNAYGFLLPMIFVSIPAAFIPDYFAVGDIVRRYAALLYFFVLYTAFVGKLIFYAHYHDIYNHILWLGKNAEKKNLLDVFFNENHGFLVLMSYIPLLALANEILNGLLALPMIAYPKIDSAILQYLVNTIFFCLLLVGFYYFRYGGKLSHDDKPEWDTIPALVKKDIFLARACVDDLVALEMVWHRPLQGLLTHTDEQDAVSINTIMPQPMRDFSQWKELRSPAEAFSHTAKGARIRPPKHIVLLVGESYTQYPLDDIYAYLHLSDRGRAFRQEPHTAVINNFLPAGMLSRPAIVSLMTGIFDARLELNEREDFWKGTVATSLPVQLHKLGYHSIYWYGGNSTYGNFNQYAPAVGFDEVRAAVDFCPKDAPRTCVGVYDDVFLRETVRQIEQMDDQPTLHFIYTTTNHGPYKMDLQKYGYETEKIMPEAPDKLKKSHHWQQVMGTHWYADQTMMQFVDDIRKIFPDTLIFVTGDHAAGPIPLNMGVIDRAEITIREHFCTSFSMCHPELDQGILAENTIGGHMNILPTIFELLAPKGFEYYSLFDSLTEPIHQVLTPYHWLTEQAIGSSENAFYQGLGAVASPVETFAEKDGKNRFLQEIQGYESLTGWIARHPELLYPARQF